MTEAEEADATTWLREGETEEEEAMWRSLYTWSTGCGGRHDTDPSWAMSFY
jgi:hypothetical protein